MGLTRSSGHYTQQNDKKSRVRNSSKDDYSEAVTAIIGIQKKLAKALRDAASAKIASEVAGMPSRRT